MFLAQEVNRYTQSQERRSQDLSGKTNVSGGMKKPGPARHLLSAYRHTAYLESKAGVGYTVLAVVKVAIKRTCK